MNPIQAGELMYLAHEKSTFMIPFQPKGALSTHKGQLQFGEEHFFGQKVYTNLNEAFTILRPAISDRIMKVKRTTTISYPKDIGAVLMETDIYSGAKIVDIGSGSGGFAIAVSSILGETGRLYSFERRPEHQASAIKNFAKLARFANTEFILKDDVAETGFGLDFEVDTVYIDVPDPAALFPAAYEVLKGGGHLAIIIPCVEQWADAVRALYKNGFTRVRGKEIFERGLRPTPGRTRPYDRMVAHTVYLLFAQKGEPYERWEAPTDDLSEEIE
ncbi:MAG: tRNA (adenine-N1)-methyltransferase [Brevinema sp.]